MDKVVALKEYRCSLEPPDSEEFPAILSWEPLPDRGRGLIARTDFEPGAIIDFAPAIPAREEDCSDMLRQYIFKCHRDCCARPYTGPVEYAFVFGPMALCNHSDEPNADVCFSSDPARGLEARLIARHRVRKGEEITILYTDKNWYEKNGRF